MLVAAAACVPVGSSGTNKNQDNFIPVLLEGAQSTAAGTCSAAPLYKHLEIEWAQGLRCLFIAPVFITKGSDSWPRGFKFVQSLLSH